ncbi:MAG: hypothetical protein IJ039_01180 [Clostridia bacterium]|nr:hypothetical protein [Clostridia bacterium]
MAKNLLLGLGGTGSRIVNYVAADLKKKNIRINDGNISCAVIDRYCYEQDRFKQAGTDVLNFAIRNPSGLHPLKTYFDMYENCGLGDWMPSPIGIYTDVWYARMGARLEFYDYIKSGAIGELEKEIDKLIDENKETVTVQIVSSLAGATGSGILIQTAMWVRQYFERKNVPVTIKGILVLPEVFIRTVSQIGRDENECRALRANAYATVRELNAITKVKTKGYTPTNPIIIDEVGFNSNDKASFDGTPVFDNIYFLDDVTASGSACKYIVDYEKAAACMIYMQMLEPVDDGPYDDALFRVYPISEEPLYGSCGAARAEYPVASVLEYCALRAAKDELSADWRKIDQIINGIIKREKELEDDSMAPTNPRKEYIRQFDERANNREGKDTLLYKIRRDVKNESLGLKGDRCVIMLSDKIDDLLHVFDRNIRSIIENENPGNLSEIKIKYERENWVNDSNKLYCIENAKEFVFHKRNEVAGFIHALDVNIDLLAKDLADSICPIDMSDVNETDLGTVMGLFAKKDEDGQVYFVHPIAIRYLIYKLKNELEERKRIGTRLEYLRDSLSFNKATQRYESEIYMFDKTKTYEYEDALIYLDKKPLLISETKFLKQYKELYYEFNAEQYQECCRYAEKYLSYKTSVILCERIEMLIKIVERFFNNIDELPVEIDDRIADNVYETENNGNNVYYICASGKEKEALYESLNVKTSNSNTELNKTVAAAFYAQLCVKENPDAKSNRQYAGKNPLEIFANELIKTYEKTIGDYYSEEIDLDLYSAVCKSSDFEYKRENGDAEEDSNSRVKRHMKAMKDWVARVQSNSSPYLCVKDDIESDFSKTKIFWGFSPELASACPELSYVLGVNMETRQNEAYSKYELACFCAIEGLFASNISRFDEMNTYDSYYASYKELVDEMNEKVAGGDEGALVMTPHLDKTWHKILPYISKMKGKNAETQFFRNFWFAVAYGMITVNKEDHYQIERTKKNAMGTYKEDETLKYRNAPIARPEIGRLIEALRLDDSFARDVEECVDKFKKECHDNVNCKDTLFLNGIVIKDEKGDDVKHVIGGLGSASDTNALTLIVRYLNASESCYDIAEKLVSSLESLCFELAKGEPQELYKIIYNACELPAKDIDLIAHWNIKE